MAYQSNTNSVTQPSSSTSMQINQPVQTVQITQVVNPMLGLTNVISGTYQAVSNNLMQNPHYFGSDPNTIFQNTFNYSMGHMLTNLPQIMNFTNQISGFFMQNLINSGQSYRPATQQEIAALPRIAKPHDCAICQS